MSAVVTPGNLQANDFNLGTDIANSITVNVDGTTVVRGAATGLESPNQALSFNNGTNELTLTNNGAADTVIDLSALTADIYVTGASMVGTVLTLTDNDAGTPDVTIDLAAFVSGPSADAGNLLTTGTDGLSLLTSVVSGDANNVIGTGSDGLAFFDSSTLAACTDAFGVDIFRAFPV